MKSAPSIAFDARPSRALSYAVALGVFAAIVAPWRTDLPVTARVVASLAVFLVGVVSLRRFVRTRAMRIAFGASGWTLAGAEGDPEPVDLVAHRLLGAWLSLDFRTASRRRVRVVLGPDNCDADTRRRLALMLARAEIARPTPPV